MGLATIFGLIYDALRQLEVSAPGYTPGDPLSVHFKVRNPSFLFTARNVRSSCDLVRVVFPRNTVFENVIIDSAPDSYDLIGGGSLEYRCEFRTTVLIPGEPQVATVRIGGRYETLWFERTFASHPLSWDAASRSWNEGTQVN